MIAKRFVSTAAVLAAVLAATAQGQLLYDNQVPPAAAGGLNTGPVSKSGVSAPAGTNWSEVQNDAGDCTVSNTVAGYACSMDVTGTAVPTGGFRLSDNFTVPPGPNWDVARITVYAYHTGGAATTPQVDAVRLQIWDGPPNAGGTVIFGDMTTNRLLVAQNSGLYRIFNSTCPPPGSAPGTTRVVWACQVSTLTAGAPLSLPPGTYWVDWQSSNLANTNHFAPSVTVVDSRGVAGANGIQFVGPAPGTWTALIDDGNPTTGADIPQEVPFQVHGDIPLSASGSANPGCLSLGQNTLLTVAVSQFPASATTVEADLSPIGGSANQMLFDDGTNGDVTAGDNVFSYLATVTAGSGNVNLNFTATNAVPQTATGAIAVAVVPTADFTETEGNDSKAAANLIAGMANGQSLSGVSTSASGVGLDYYRVKTAAAPMGIYRHRLQLLSCTAGHTGTLRGLNQIAAPADTQPGIPWDGVVGTAGATDTTMQTSSTTTNPPRMNQWYGFGKEEEIFYRVTGVAATTSEYFATLETTPVTPTDIGTFVPGLITINTNGQGHTSDTDLWVYDSNFNAINGYGDDDSSNALSGAPIATTSLQSWLAREYSPGVYYIAMSNFQTFNNRPSPSDDQFRTGTLLDFPDVIGNSSTTVNLNMTFTIADSARTSVQVPNTKVGVFDINWFRFEVVSPCIPADINCDGVVNVSDLLAVINAWGTCPAPPDPCPADTNGDGVVNVSDLLAVINNWG